MADIDIQTNTSSLAEKRAARKQRKTTRWIITAAVAACLAFVGLIVATSWKRPPKDIESISEQTGAAKPDRQLAGTPAETPKTSAASEPTLVADDGRTMWMSPTSGKAIDPRGLPTGCEMFVALRPAEMLATDEGDKLLAALGPLGKKGQAYVESATNLELADIDRLLIGLRPASEFEIEPALVVTPSVDTHADRPDDCYELAPDTFVVAPRRVLDEIKQLDGTSPPLRREMESLLATTDRDRHATVIVAPSFLFSDGRKMWHGSVAGLRDPLFAMLPDATRGAALSLHAGDEFFAELRLVSTLDVRPQRFAEQLANSVAAWPAQVEWEIAQVTASAYSAAVVARLPAMLRVVSRYQRMGVDNSQALLRIYLPPPAGHNLIMAGELLLAERMERDPAIESAVAGASGPMSLAQRLTQRTSLSFTRDTLETAVALLAEEIGADIVILGGDLQLDGITKNQSFGLNEQDKPASEILVAILRLANPDKTASGPADPKQKLVYAIRPDRSTGEPSIVVTTRAQAEKRGETLPSVFTD